MKKLIFSALLLGGCVHVPLNARRSLCPSEPPDSVRPFTAADAAALVGSFDLVQVNTAWDPAPVYRMRLTLALPDSGERRRLMERPLFPPPRAIQLIGYWHWPADEMKRPVEVDAGVLYIGCRDCTDASPEHLRISRFSSTGFSGVWNDFQTGIGYAVDDRGRRLPDPSGYFCALRRP